MKKTIRLTETELTNLIGKIVMEQTYSVVDDPMKGIGNTFSHQQTTQADDAKDSITNVNITKATDVEHNPDAMFEEDEMPEEWMDELEDETGVQRPMSYPPDIPDTDVQYSNMPMPSPTRTPTPAPTKTPTRTPTPSKPRRQDPFKVPHIQPGEEPAPKAGMEKEREMLTMGESQLIGMIEKLVIEATKGKCPESGCIKKVDKKWRVISNKTGKLWPAHYDTQKAAQAGLDAYHANN